MRKLHNKKTHATLTNPDELLDSPLRGTDGRMDTPIDTPSEELDEGPEADEPPDTPQDTSGPPEEAAGVIQEMLDGTADALVAEADPAQADTEGQTPPPPLQLPIALALPEQTRRVREQVLPAWYAHRYNPASPLANDPAVADYLMTINAALSAADHAMMTQDVGLMIFAYRNLERMQT